MRTKNAKLLAWLKEADDEAIGRTGTTRAYLKQIAYGNKTASPMIAAGVERETGRAITRQELRPADWTLLWPELAVA